MTFQDAVKFCHVRSAIYREGDKYKNDGSGRLKLYWKNHTESLESRVPLADQACDDWQEYDPEEDCMPA